MLDGLQPGERVVRNPPAGLTDGMAVTTPRPLAPDRSANPTPPLVSVRGVSKVYERGTSGVEVLHHVDLDIPRGDFLALMGPSGSGKTTLLNLIAGLDVPTDGQPHRRGHPHRPPVVRRARALACRQRRLRLPVLQPPARAVGAQERRASAAAHAPVGPQPAPPRGGRAGAGRARRTASPHKPAELSGGQQQRVAIARAIVSDPTLLVCDEPTGDLDRHSAEDVLTLLQRLNREYGKTMIMVTHDPKAAEFAQRTLHLDKGTLVEQAA